MGQTWAAPTLVAVFVGSFQVSKSPAICWSHGFSVFTKKLQSKQTLDVSLQHVLDVLANYK